VPGQNAQANPTNYDDREAKPHPELFLVRNLAKASFFWQTGLGRAALTLGWARMAQPSPGLGWSDPGQAKPWVEPNWASRQDELSWKHIKTKMQDSIRTLDCWCCPDSQQKYNVEDIWATAGTLIFFLNVTLW
jgi:hypothetical protein